MTTTLRSALQLALLSGTITGVSFASLVAQPDATSEPTPTPVSTPTMDAARADEDARPRVSLTQELPWLLRRAGILDLRLHESPSPLDYELTANMLSLSADLDPDNAELLREMAQAGWLAGDQALMLDATRRVIRIDPKDSVAQLRLISAKINEKQTLEGRKALYDRFLSDAGKSIDPSVRSRLALDAALLEREAGNTAGFIERLHQATKLDMTNKAAASLAAQYYSSIRDDPSVTMDYQMRLLMADPLDANVHMTIARLLARQGALKSAQRYLKNALTLYTLETGRPPQDLEEVRIAIEWQTEGAEAPMGHLNAAINDQRVAAQARIDAYEQQQLPTDELIKPEEIRYSIGVDKLRLLAAHADGDEEQARSVLTDIERSINEQNLQYAKAAQAPGANVNSLLSHVIQRIGELQAMRAVVGLDADKIRKDLEEIKKNQPQIASRLKSVEPMALFAEGKYQQALDASEPYQNSPVIGLIRAQSLERLGKTDEAIELYVQLARRNATNAYGAFAHARLDKLATGDRVLTDAGRQMRAIADKAPAWIEEMIERPSSFQYLSISQDKAMYSEGERPMVTIRLQNTAPIPLALGPNAPIDSRMLIEPVGVATLQNGFVGTPRPKVLQLDNRLRLMPREELSVRIVADSATTDWLIDQQPSVSMRERWRLVQSFQPRITDETARQRNADANEQVFGITNSPLGLTTETQVVQRLGLTSYGADASELIAMLGTGDPDTRRRALTVINARMMSQNPEDQFDADTMQRIIDSINTLYTQSSPKMRAAMMLTLPQRHQVPAMVGFDDQVASSLLSDAMIDSKVDPIELACALLTRTDDPDAPIFETIEHVDEPRVKRISEIVRDRLRNNTPMLGTVGPGLDAMTPTFDGLEY